MKRHIWTSEQLAYLQANYADTPSQILVDYFDVPIYKIYSKARRLKLQKSEAFLKSEASGRLRSETGAAYRFQQGNISRNKGKKMPSEVYQKIQATMFQKGRKPHNTTYDGFEALHSDGYTYIRLSEKNFELKQRVVWETIYGKIPDGQIVVFKDGDRANFDIENLELITREENMRRNTIQNYPDDLQKVIRIFHKLSKKVSAHEKQVARPI